MKLSRRSSRDAHTIAVKLCPMRFALRGFIAAVYRLGRSTLNAPVQVVIAVVAGVLVAYTLISIVATLLAAACVALALGRHRAQGLVAGLVVSDAGARAPIGHLMHAGQNGHYAESCGRIP